MPVEIKELVIRAVVEPRRSNADSGAATLRSQAIASPSLPATSATSPTMMSAGDRRAVVQACVKEVMRQLEKSRER